MNIVSFGTSDFAMPALRMLLESQHKVLAVVTQPDRKKGRSLKISPPPTKVLAVENNIPVHQPQNASSESSIGYLKKFNADLFVVVSFGQILSKEALEVPKLFSINLHTSLLPKYRGAAPINWAIINGDKVTGVTVIRMNERMDEGDIILKEELDIDPKDTSITLGEKLSDLGSRTLLKTIDMIEHGNMSFVRQEDRDVTYAPKLTKKDGLIDWNEPALKIHNKVRGLVPWPSAYTHFDGKVLKVLKTEVIDDCRAGLNLPYNPDDLSRSGPGEVLQISKDGIYVKTPSGVLLITHVQLEGKIPMDVASFLRGHKLSIGHRFMYHEI